MASCRPRDCHFQCDGGDPQLAAAFFDWFHTADGVSAMTLGAAAEPGFGGAVVAAQLRGALRAQADRLIEVDRALLTAHDVLASLSAGSHGRYAAFAACCRPAPAARTKPAGQANTAESSATVPIVRSPANKMGPAPSFGSDGDEIRFAAAGNVHALVVSTAGCRPLVQPTDRLAIALAPGWSEIRTRLSPGESLLVYAAGALDARWRQADAAATLLADRLVAALPCDAGALADVAAQAIAEAASAAGTGPDGALLVIRPV